MSNASEVTKCIACDSSNLIPTLDLGNQPLANDYLTDPQSKEEFYPLAVNRCQDCNHLQLTHIVNPEVIYKNYSYVSGTTKTYVDYMSWFADWTREYTNCWQGDVLDIGCNDGSQLDAYANIGFNTYGVDPAENLYKTSSDKGHNVVCGFWDDKSIEKLKENKFDIAVSQNAFAHIPNPHKYLQLLHPLMKDGGLFFIQTSQADMVLNGEFDTIYHEHISFYNVQSMKELAQRSGWNLVDVIKTPIHGTSYVFVLSPNRVRPENIANLIAVESKLHNPSTYDTWVSGVSRIKDEFVCVCEKYRSQGYKLVGYGAAAKGMTMLNYVNVKLDCIIDDNPLKQGKWSPGQVIPIVGPEYLDGVQSSDKILFIPLAWNFFNEIVKRIKARRDNENDKYLTYFPKVEIKK